MTNHKQKSIEFIGTTRKDIASFPDDARFVAGRELWQLQIGNETFDFKPMPTIGSGAYEIRIKTGEGAFRVIYVAKFKDAIYALHAFQKKTQKTSLHDIDLAKRRYNQIPK